MQKYQITQLFQSKKKICKSSYHLLNFYNTLFAILLRYLDYFGLLETQAIQHTLRGTTSQ